MPPIHLTDADREQLRGRAISVDEFDRQLSLFRKPRRFMRLVRPCTVGDGIRRIAPDETDEFLGLHAEAAAKGRFAKFVPASGRRRACSVNYWSTRRVPGGKRRGRPCSSERRAVTSRLEL